ncbi:hypothetical protein Ae201684P_022156 [Aphanomyces euteiches]|nr:hypothetical protein Ae201684P_022156 [Aphanomyces euteiches]
MIQVNTAGLEERISHLSDAFRARQSGAVDSPYEIIKTPDLDDGALVSAPHCPCGHAKDGACIASIFPLGKATKLQPTL